jgi:hypothetical protein
MDTTTTAGKPALLSTGSPQHLVPNFQQASDYDFPERTAVAIKTMHYEDGQSTNYGQSPAYMHPNAPARTLFGCTGFTTCHYI